MHSKNRSHIVAALSLAHLASSCRGLRPLRFTASASNVHSVNNVRTTDTWPSLTATCNALSPSAFTASKLMLFYANENLFDTMGISRLGLLISIHSMLDSFLLAIMQRQQRHVLLWPPRAARCSYLHLYRWHEHPLKSNFALTSHSPTRRQDVGVVFV